MSSILCTAKWKGFRFIEFFPNVFLHIWSTLFFNRLFSFSYFFYISPFFLLLSFFLYVLSILFLSFHSRPLTLPLFSNPNISTSLFHHIFLISFIILLLSAYIPLFHFISSFIHPFLLSPSPFCFLFFLPVPFLTPFRFYLNIPSSVSPFLYFFPLMPLHLLFFTLDIPSFVSHLQYALLNSSFFCYFPSISLPPFLRLFVYYP
jgi:hypothetical protein